MTERKHSDKKYVEIFNYRHVGITGLPGKTIFIRKMIIEHREVPNIARKKKTKHFPREKCSL
jgi:hypothetical protein